MAKEVISLCPEKNVYVSGDERKISDKQMDAANFERTPLLDPDLKWVCVPQENFATRVNITGVGERISKRFWFVGFTTAGEIQSVRSISVASLRAMGLGLVKEGVSAPVILATTNEDGSIRTAPGTQYIHAMEDTSWIKGENHFYVVKTPVAIQPLGSAEVYQAKFVEGHMQAEDGKVALVTANMKFFKLLAAPTAEEVKAATDTLKSEVRDQFYAL